MKNNLEIFEVCPNPSKQTMVILRKMYSSGGPIYNMSKRYGIYYQNTNFFKLKNGILYIDKNLEKKSIKTNLFTFFKIATANTFNRKDLLSRAIKLISSKPNFYKNYELVAEIDFLYSIAYKKLESICKFKNIDLLKILNSTKSPKLRLNLKKIKILGNSIELTDTSPFYTSLSKKIAKKGSKTIANDLKILEVARELGRILALKDLYPYKVNWQNSYKLKSSSNSKVTLVKKHIFVSGSNLSGILISKNDLENIQKYKSPVLFINNLDPRYVSYLPKLSGIISAQGSPLSHLAIVAREMNLPVLIGYSPLATQFYKTICLGSK